MRAAKLCSHGDCVKVQPCPDHAPKPWARRDGSHRSSLSGSRQQRRARYVIDRDDTICHVCQRPGADEADHIVPTAHGGADSVENMAAIHSEPCHREKTEREAKHG